MSTMKNGSLLEQNIYAEFLLLLTEANEDIYTKDYFSLEGKEISFYLFREKKIAKFSSLMV